MTLLVVLTALGAALCFGTATACMHRGASSAPARLAALALIRHLVRQRIWLVGMLASLTGLALHVLALGLGPLALVQPLVVTGLVFSFLIREALERRVPGLVTTAWVGVTALGLVLFLTTATSVSGTSTPDDGGAGVVLGVGGAAAALTWALSLTAEPTRRGLLLGVSAGIVFGLIAGTLKAATGLATHGSALLSSWPLFLLAPLGVCGFLLNQRAYHRAPLASSVPALTVVNAVVSVAFGIIAFGEWPTGRLVALCVRILGLFLMSAGVVALARRPDLGPSQPVPDASRCHDDRGRRPRVAAATGDVGSGRP